MFKKELSLKRIYSITAIILAISIICICLFTSSSYKLPFYLKGFDIYSNIGLTRVMESLLDKNIVLEENFFPALLKNDIHLGLNFLNDVILIKITGIDCIKLILIKILFNIVLLVFSVYLFIKTVLVKEKPKVWIVTIILYFLLSSSILSLLGSSLSFTDLMISAYAPYVFGYSIFLILLSMNISCIKNSTKILLNILLFTILFSSHLLTGIVFLGVYFFLIISKIINKTLKKEDILMLIIFSVIMILLLFWPYSNWIEFFIKSEPIKTYKLANPDINLEKVLNFLSFLVLGLILLFKRIKKNIFLILWSISFFMVSISFMLPIRIALYWRFLMFMKMPLLIGFVTYFFSFNTKNNMYRVVIISIIVLLAILLNVENITNVISKDVNLPSVISNLSKNIPANSKILADPYISYDLQAFKNVNVYLFAGGHIQNPKSIEINNQRVERYYSLLNDINQSKFIKFTEDGGVDVVILNKYTKSLEYTESLKLYGWHLIYEDKIFTVFSK